MKVLVVLDTTELSRKPLLWVRQFVDQVADPSAMHVFFLCVTPVSRLWSLGEPLDSPLGADTPTGLLTLVTNWVQEVFRDTHATTAIKQERGSLIELAVEFAAKEHCDLIVLHWRKRGLLESWVRVLAGSFGLRSRLFDAAPCPVLVVI